MDPAVMRANALKANAAMRRNRDARWEAKTAGLTAAEAARKAYTSGYTAGYLAGRKKARLAQREVA